MDYTLLALRPLALPCRREHSAVLHARERERARQRERCGSTEHVPERAGAGRAGHATTLAPENKHTTIITTIHTHQSQCLPHHNVLEIEDEYQYEHSVANAVRYKHNVSSPYSFD